MTGVDRLDELKAYCVPASGTSSGAGDAGATGTGSGGAGGGAT